jgi:hypothetical protein
VSNNVVYSFYGDNFGVNIENQVACGVGDGRGVGVVVM